MKEFIHFIKLVAVSDIDKIKINVTNKHLSSLFMDRHRSVVGKVKYNIAPFDIKSPTSIVISELKVLKKMLQTFNEPTFSLVYSEYNVNDTDPKLIQIKEGKLTSDFYLAQLTREEQIPDISKDKNEYLVEELKLDEDDKKSFMDISRVMTSESKKMNFVSDGNKLNVVFGNITKGKFLTYNNMSYTLLDDYDGDPIDISLDAKTFMAILTANYKSEIRLNISNKFVNIKAKGEENSYKVIYYMAKYSETK